MKGTAYTLTVNPDTESLEFIGSVDKVLRAAGWVPKQPPPRFGIPNIRIFGEDVESCIGTGIVVTLKEKRHADYFQHLSPNDFPENLKVARATLDAFSNKVLPEDDRNVLRVVQLNADTGDTADIVFCIGRHP